MQIVNTIQSILSVIVFVLFSYQILYYLVALFDEAKQRIKEKKGIFKKSRKDYSTIPKKKFAFLLAARNEENVIGYLIDSIRNNDYPQENVDIYVVADNCDDNTAEVAKEHGAFVCRRSDKNQVGKGYALNYLLHRIRKFKGGWDAYDGYIIFDADNILDKDYINAINTKMNEGYRMVTGYRNSKNFDSNWISASYSIAFMREAKYLNNPRRLLNASATVSGTGFAIANSIIEENDGWPFHLLTEDIQLSTHYIIKGEKIAYAEEAMFYDEQPTTFKQSWNQRIRWTKGFYQVLFRYGKDLSRVLFKDKKMFLSRYDMLMFLAPSLLFNIATLVLVVFAIILNLLDFQMAMETLPYSLSAIGMGLLSFYLLNLGQAFLTILTEWKKIVAPKKARIGYMFMYPIYMFTYLPLSFIALFASKKWKPIKHTATTSLTEMEAKIKAAKADN